MELTNLLASFCLAASITLISVSWASARELKQGVGLQPASPLHYILEVFTKTLKEKWAGELEIKIFPLSLLNLPQMFAGLRDGVADIGFFLQSIFISESRERQLATELVSSYSTSS